LEDTRDFNTRYLTLMEEGGCTPNVTFGSNCSVKNVVREGANESTRVVNSYRRDEISIDPSRGSEISKWGRTLERGRKKSKRGIEREREILIKGWKKEGDTLISGFSK